MPAHQDRKSTFVMKIRIHRSRAGLFCPFLPSPNHNPNLDEPIGEWTPSIHQAIHEGRKWLENNIRPGHRMDYVLYREWSNDDER